MESEQGTCLWLTGLSGAGKTTIAESLHAKLTGLGKRSQHLDGDTLRNSDTKKLGFSRSDRIENIRRAGRLAAETSLTCDYVVASLISPIAQARQEVRDLFSPGKFIEIYVDTPLETCEARDVKGLYAKARTGEIEHFTGISDTYEAPECPDIHFDTTDMPVDASVDLILRAIRIL